MESSQSPETAFTEAKGNTDLDALLNEALRQKEVVISRSSILKEFQESIDSAMTGCEELNERFDSLGFAAKKWRIKRDLRPGFDPSSI